MTEDNGKKAAPSVSSHLLFWPIFIAGVALDLWSKSAVFNWLADSNQHGFIVIKGFLNLQLAQNRGAAFGIAAGQRTLLVAVSVAALVVVFAVFLFAGTQRKIVHVALALFAAGVCGNLYDRLFNNGLVRDFIDVVYWPGRHWPAFNVADSLLCIAVGLLLLSSFSTHSSCQKPAQPQK
ncbi:MAG: signal peptidase II [Planctomycetota bacterium]